MPKIRSSKPQTARNASKRKRPVRRPVENSKYPSRPRERAKGDEDFQEGWGFNHDTGTVAHYFVPSTAGMRVSLCRHLLQAPVWISPTVSETDRRCRACIRYLERREKMAQVRREAELKRQFDDRVARFLSDPSLGPRLYGCPVCRSVYEGMAPNLFPCSEAGHESTLVVELARKDTWTRDKP